MGFKNEHVHGKKDVTRINERKARGRRVRLARTPGRLSMVSGVAPISHCAMSLAAGKGTQTDCSINGQLEGKTYCFGSKEAMAEFMKN
jgi:hypothetical protein